MLHVAVCASEPREQIILAHLPHVIIIAKKIHWSCPSQVLLDDLVSAGLLGLVEAYERFDISRNLKFKTFAGHRIRGAMLDYLRQVDPLSRTVRRFQNARSAAIAQISARIGSNPLEEPIANQMGLEIARYRRLSRIVNTSTSVSLDAMDPLPLQLLRLVTLTLTSAFTRWTLPCIGSRM